MLCSFWYPGIRTASTECGSGFTQQNLKFVSRSRQEVVSDTTQVLIADTLGELLMLYAAADVAFVGGSLVPIGGHNLLEPAALARPIITGPHNFNAPEIAQLLLDSGAAVRVESAAALARMLSELAARPEERERMGRAAMAILEANRGALNRVMALVEPRLSSAGRVH